MKKLCSVTLFLAIAMSMLFFCVLAGGAMAEGGKIADPSTMLEYKKYFSTGTTNYAGLIWTDKSVFTTSDELAEGIGGTLPTVQCPTHKAPDYTHQTIALTPEWEKQPEADNPNFLVALSASASNKSITGYEKKPTDTIFVLDISGSMDTPSKGADGNDIPKSERILKLVPAVNHAIEQLMNNNPNNRIGVVVFAGTEASVEELLPLGRYYYKANTQKTYKGNYIDVQSTGDNADIGDYIWVNSNVYKEGENAADDKQVNPNGNGEGGTTYRVEGNTYIQGGLQLAHQLFQNVASDDIKAEIVVKDEVHTTIRRIPALILVTDGNPTKSTLDYYDDVNAWTGGKQTNPDPDNDGISDILMGSGGDADTTIGMAFLCQLTSIWVKEEMGKKYNEIGDGDDISNVPDPVTPLFYTLGILTQDKAPARAVLYPANNAGHTNADESMNNYWSQYKGTGDVKVRISNEENLQPVNRRSGIVNGNRYSPNQNYVDGYFQITEANDTTDGYDEVLQAIVRAIELQSHYTPTMLQISDGFHDGYVTFIDDIGEHMEVKDVKGFVLDGKLFTGEHVAQMMDTTTLGGLQAGDLGNSSGHKLIDAIATRLGLSTTIGSAQRQQAIALLSQAFKDGLLGTAVNNENFAAGVTVGNSFGWFADEDGGFVGIAPDNTVGSGNYDNPPDAYWNWLTDEQTVPANAEYKVRSYIFYDEIDPKPGDDAYGTEISELNTVYMSVQVREHIATGKVSLIWRIPSKLLPINQYSVKLQNENSEVNTIGLKTKLPASLIYEVGPKDGYKSYQIEKTMRELRKPEGSPYTPVDAKDLDEDIDHIVKDSDGFYHLYTNAVDKEPTNPANVTQHVNTVSYFKPSNQNERYRFSAPTYLYQITGSSSEPTEINTSKVTGGEATLPSGEYWYKQYVFVQNGEKKIETVWHKLDSEILNPGAGHHGGHAHVEKDKDGYWYVTVNTIEYPRDPIIEVKKADPAKPAIPANPTDTLMHSSRSVREQIGVSYEHDGIQAGDFVIANVLGNNGLLTVRQDTGIAIGKVSSANDTAIYTFNVTLTDKDGNPVNKEYDLKYEPQHTDAHRSKVRFVDGEAEVAVKAGETAHIIGLAGGEIFSITEEMSTGHKLEKIVVTDVDGREKTVLEAENISVVPGHQIYVTYTNAMPPSPTDGFGMLALRKIATHNYKRGFDIPMDAEFVFQLTFEKAVQGKNIYAKDVLYDTEGHAYELDGKGMTADGVTLNPNQEIVFAGLEEGTKVTIKEIVGPEAAYKIEEIIGPTQDFVVNKDNTAEITISDHKVEYRVTVNNMYVEPFLPDTGDESRLILWASLLSVCAVSVLLLRKRREN